MTTRFLFVGERPSHQAVKIGATWQNGKLAAKQLHDALRALNIDPAEHEYCNLYRDADHSAQDALHEAQALLAIQGAYRRGLVIVGMGQIVCAVLVRASIPHLRMIHPAARGAIRRKDRYQEHVRSILL